MTYKIVDKDGKNAIESYITPAAAKRAMLILSAHELKNGREAKYRIDPPIDPDPPVSELDLPDWALEELKKHGLA